MYRMGEKNAKGPHALLWCGEKAINLHAVGLAFSAYLIITVIIPYFSQN